MSAPTRRVRRLRLSAPDPGLVQQGAFLFEDALRVADLPEADGGRLLLIRALDVGTIGSESGTMPLAKVLARKVDRCASAAVHGSDPAAGASIAVYFADRAEACALLAQRLAASSPVDAWFWPLAVPDWRPELDRPPALRTVLLALVEIPGGVATAAQLVLDLAARGSLAPLMRALRPADGDRLLTACGWAPGSRSVEAVSRPATGRASPIRAPAALTAALDRVLLAWDGDDSRTLWLACAVLAGERPELALDRRLADRAGRMIESAVRRRGAARRAGNGASPPRRPLGTASSRRRDPPPSAAAIEEARDGGAEGTPAREDGFVRRRAGRSETRAGHPSEPPGAARPNPPPPLWRLEPIAELDGDDAPVDPSADLAARRWAPGPARGGGPSAVAGLLFALQVLRRLGIEGFIEAHPELGVWAIAARVLRRLARHLDAPGDDPLLAVLSPRDPPCEPADLDFTLPSAWRGTVVRPGPCVWRRLERKTRAETASSRRSARETAPPRILVDPSGRLPLALRSGRLPDDLEVLVEAWLTAVRRWCRRRAGLGLFDLARRPGRVVATSTHLDVVFDYRLADVRVRRAGLDQDPGWLPWLGRVVQFHYHSQDDPHG